MLSYHYWCMNTFCRNDCPSWAFVGVLDCVLYDVADHDGSEAHNNVNDKPNAGVWTWWHANICRRNAGNYLI